MPLSAIPITILSDPLFFLYFYAGDFYAGGKSTLKQRFKQKRRVILTNLQNIFTLADL